MCNNNILRFCLSVIGKSSRYPNKIDCHVQERTTCTFFILTMRVCNGVSKWKMTKVYNFIPLQLEILISILIIYCTTYYFYIFVVTFLLFQQIFFYIWFSASTWPSWCLSLAFVGHKAISVPKNQCEASTLFYDRRRKRKKLWEFANTFSKGKHE